MKGSQKTIDTLIRLKDDIPCEICHLKPAPQTLPRGPLNSGSISVCGDCETKLYRGGEH